MMLEGGAMTAAEIVKELKPLGSEGYKKILLNHGVQEPVLGVKIEELKKIQKRVKKDYRLALDLFDTGIYDAMYLAGLIADDSKMTKKDLEHWLKKADAQMISEYTLPWVAAESNHGRELALKWIDSKKEAVAVAGWATLAGLAAIKDDAELDLAEFKRLLARVQKTIHDQPNRVRYVMNSFVIAVGSYVKGLTDLAVQTAGKVGPVSVDMGETACKVPSAVEYIKKVRDRGAIGKKRKSVKC
jgi:3-methyladenine DNA glycosylase AlkD